MKSILLIFLAMTFCSKNNTNEKFVIICKASNDTIRVNYLDSTHGITNIDSAVKEDTLLLKIYVRLSEPMKSIDVRLSEGVKYINTGSVVYQIDELGSCEKIYSGEDAIQELKKLKIK